MQRGFSIPSRFFSIFANRRKDYIMKKTFRAFRAFALIFLSLGLLFTGAGTGGGCGSQSNNGGGGGGGGGTAIPSEEDVIGGGADENGNGVSDAVEAVLARCGDGSIDSGEECDDGNTADGDGCSSSCIAVSPTCGDGFVNDPAENCDDGNAVDEDSCNNNCRPPTVIQVTAGISHTCVLKSNGRVTCWGLNSSGQLGYGHTQNIGDDPGETPASAAKSGLGGDVDVGGKVIQIEAGGLHTCALLETGNVRCWGAGSSGQLGYGNINSIGDNEAPASAGDVPLGGKAVQISAGAAHTCALLDTGRMRCWGKTTFGRLGYSRQIAFDHGANLGDQPGDTPNIIGDADVGGDISQISAGDEHTCALFVVGGVASKVRCWGKGVNGRLGYADVFITGTISILDLEEALGDKVNEIDLVLSPDGANRFVPSEQSGQASNLVAAGGSHTCVAQRTPNRLRCWGFGGNGQLGNASTEDYGDDAGETPDQEFSSTFDFTQLALGTAHSCGLLSPIGAMSCWGVGVAGALGYGNPDNVGDNETVNSAGVVPVGGEVLQIAAGAGHTCAVLKSGYVRCWGDNLSGQLGYGNTDDIGNTPATTPEKMGNVSVDGWVCGNGVLETTEACDDGNNQNGDGCTAGCFVE